MKNHDDEIGKSEVLDLESNNPPTPIIGSNNLVSAQTSIVSNVPDDETIFIRD